ncbi:hypothetical protein I7I51_01104 [Histoplasma capsulatum]|uniref:Uncharacterized protein n=1 Tax=Ajellomyces capsulatus TaxID=5037 RepID=A0A8A1MHJ5_AJECA|nr:hypothetical protein I7I51_01104 [Histoplasma capsulatum]
MGPSILELSHSWLFKKEPSDAERCPTGFHISFIQHDSDIIRKDKLTHHRRNMILGHTRRVASRRRLSGLSPASLNGFDPQYDFVFLNLEVPVDEMGSKHFWTLKHAKRPASS